MAHIYLHCPWNLIAIICLRFSPELKISKDLFRQDTGKKPHLNDSFCSRVILFRRLFDDAFKKKRSRGFVKNLLLYWSVIKNSPNITTTKLKASIWCRRINANGLLSLSSSYRHQSESKCLNNRHQREKRSNQKSRCLMLSCRLLGKMLHKLFWRGRRRRLRELRCVSLPVCDWII